MCMSHGLSFAEAATMDTLMRRAFAYRIAIFNGKVVDWRTGLVRDPPRGS